jgi:tetratricopeptide (TPR) repeat protein
MNNLRIVLIIFSIVSMSNCKEKSNKQNSESSITVTKPNDTAIAGKWKRVSPNGPLSIHFKENGKVEIDLGDDSSTDIVSNYKIINDTIRFIDEKGKSCPEIGVYKIYNRGYTVSFDLINDLCNGRIKSTMGFWVRTNHNELISDLNTIIENSNDFKFILHRARMYLALRRTKLAKKDFDSYIKKDSLDANVFINRASIRFPYDLKGVVYDCNKSINLDSTNKNAYFLRGLAYYGLGEKQKGCDDFQKSIDLGFEILKDAEYNKCKDYW